MTEPGHRRPYRTTEDPAAYREWNRAQWPGEETENAPGDTAAGAPAGGEVGGETPGAPSSPPDPARWNKAQYVGEDAEGRHSEPQAAKDMTEGEHGRSGHRHTDEAAHWARAADEQDPAGE